MLHPAYFLTWTTYGTWLHGDGRGSVDDGHNRRGMPLAEPDEGRVDREQGRMAEEPFVLDGKGRLVVDAAIRALCDRRGWKLVALNVRTNHVHVVVQATSHAPEVVAGQSKAAGTRALQASGLIGGRTRVWTKRASTRWINDEASLAAVVEYVVNGQ